MKYYLLKDYANGEVYGMFRFNQAISQEEIQNAIWDYNEEFFDRDLDGDGFVDGYYQTEYVSRAILDKFNGEEMDWDVADNLYI